MKKARVLKQAVFYAVFFGGVLSARASLADHYHVPSGSMVPTVHIGDRVIVDKTAFGLRIPATRTFFFATAPKHGEVVVLDSPENARTLLKRIIGTPGDVVAVREGHVQINGAPMGTEVPFTGPGGPDFGPMKVPEGEYLVMGDNRSNSHDGRRFGFVRQNAILGRVVRVYWRDGAPAWQPVY